MIDRPNDLNIETRRGSPYHVWNRRIRIKRITPARWFYARLIGTNGMHVAQLIHIRRVGDENISNFSV